MSVRLFIGNLPYSATEADLRALFSEVAEPAQVVLPTDRETGRPRGFAFVDFAERDHAEQVINRYNGHPFAGRPLAVSEARAREDRPAGPRPGGYGGGFSGDPPRPSGGFGGPPAAGGFSPRPGGPPRPFAPRAPEGMTPTGPETRRARGPAKGPLRKQTYDKPRGPIKQRPVSRLYDDEEDLEVAAVEFDDVSASKLGGEAAESDGPDDAPDGDGPDVEERDDEHTDDKE